MQGGGILSTQYFVMIVTAVVVGTLARALTIKEDFRQYPSYPNGYLIHLLTGFVAAALGAVAIPALMTKNFVAVTSWRWPSSSFQKTMTLDLAKAIKAEVMQMKSGDYVLLRLRITGAK